MDGHASVLVTNVCDVRLAISRFWRISLCGLAIYIGAAMKNLSSGYWDDNISWLNVIVLLGICFAIFLLGTSVESRLDIIESNCPHVQEIIE